MNDLVSLSKLIILNVFTTVIYRDDNILYITIIQRMIISSRAEVAEKNTMKNTYEQETPQM